MEFDFVPFEFGRMFLGDASLWYLFEILFRVVVIFVTAVVLLRVVSWKWLKDMSFFDYFLVVAMWSAAWDPMFYATVPLLYGVAALTFIIVLKEFLTHLTLKNDFFLQLAVPDPVLIIENGVIDEKMLFKKDIPLKAFYSKLRIQWIKNTGEIMRCYLEPSGEISIFKFEDSQVLNWQSVFPPEIFR